ncbi:hypothetical protein DAI22_09g008000 [Oryza sativa Japonica Group]|jgi:hypothetical protein|nr:hypothetical protein DAI22_09g008000 [Oryza sativa Japonica Group]
MQRVLSSLMRWRRRRGVAGARSNDPQAWDQHSVKGDGEDGATTARTVAPRRRRCRAAAARSK